MSLLIDALRQAEATQASASENLTESQTGTPALALQDMPCPEQPQATSTLRTGTHSRKPVFFEPIPPTPVQTGRARLFVTGFLIGALLAGGLSLLCLRSFPAEASPSSMAYQPAPPLSTNHTMTPVLGAPFNSVLDKAEKQALIPIEATPTAHPPTKSDRKASDGKVQPKPALSAEPGFSLRNGPANATQKNRIHQAFEACSTGRFQEAESIYREILAQDPQNTEAWTGLGEIAYQTGRKEDAQSAFRKALALDPKNASAQAMLLDLIGESDAQEAESQLQRLISEQPEAASAHFVLGNLQASQHRWKEAQAAYFTAHTLDSGNPDILYNLAISLEHLQQPEIARDFYARAAEAAKTRTAGFDPEAARTRAKPLTMNEAKP